MKDPTELNDISCKRPEDTESSLQVCTLQICCEATCAHQDDDYCQRLGQVFKYGSASTDHPIIENNDVNWEGCCEQITCKNALNDKTSTSDNNVVCSYLFKDEATEATQ